MKRYSNRHSNVIEFTQTRSNLISMSGYYKEWLQVTGEAGKPLTAVDPSGGPRIRIGDHMGAFGKEFNNQYVAELTVTANEVIIRTTWKEKTDD